LNLSPRLAGTSSVCKLPAGSSSLPRPSLTHSTHSLTHSLTLFLLFLLIVEVTISQHIEFMDNTSGDSVSECVSGGVAVVVFPPADRQARTMFRLLIQPQLEHALTHSHTHSPGTGTGTGSEGVKRVAWSDRGWRRKEDFITELEAALSVGECVSGGVVVARALRDEEAEALRAQLALTAPQVACAVV
jgi:hypothetical protein